MAMPGRSYTAASSYRYGFNGKENDNEVKGEGSQQDYGMRIYDPRLGRFLSVDPLRDDFPWFSPYQFAANMPTWAIDIDGMEADKKPNGNEGVSDRKNKSLYGTLDEVLQGGEAKNEEKKDYLRAAIKIKFEEITAIKAKASRTQDDILNSPNPLGKENAIRLKLLKGYEDEETERKKEASWLVNQLYRASEHDRDIRNYQKWLETELNVMDFGFNAMSIGASLIPSGGASAGFFLSSTEIRASLFSLRGGAGVFGSNGLRIGSYKIEALYANPRAGYGMGTFLSIKQMRNAGNLLRWDYGILHGTQSAGVHSTFRLNLFSRTFGSTKQLPWHAPFKFWKY